MDDGDRRDNKAQQGTGIGMLNSTQPQRLTLFGRRQRVVARATWRSGRSNSSTHTQSQRNTTSQSVHTGAHAPCVNCTLTGSLCCAVAVCVCCCCCGHVLHVVLCKRLYFFYKLFSRPLRRPTPTVQRHDTTTYNHQYTNTTKHTELTRQSIIIYVDSHF